VKTNFFNYDLPEDLIAQTPQKNRGESRLLVCNSNIKSIFDRQFNEIPQVLNEVFKLKEKNSRVLLIANDSRVYPARVRIRRKTGARGEVFFLERGEDKKSYHCLLRPKNKLKLGEVLYADKEEEIPLFKVTNFDPPMVSLFKDTLLDDVLDQFGEMPLPPYIQRDPLKNQSNFEMDKERYQTVYSNMNEKGSSAAPTAGLHFTPEIISECKNLNIDFAYVTLHVGLGTFLPVQSEYIENHEMHEEYYLISKYTSQKIIEFIENGWPIVFVGTTSLRAVESFFRLAFPNLDRECIQKMANERSLKSHLNVYLDKWMPTKIFIHPTNENNKVMPLIGNAIITNFHQPGSTLAMLVAALMGIHFWKEFYLYAIEKKYRFFSYGDSSLLVFGANF
jgi:S-adenosylmethionine:tRNA ribosyltransferase-isomerase